MTLPVDPRLYAAFLGVMLVMAWTPGPANLFSVATGMQKGKRAALVCVAGLHTGTLVWFAGAGGARRQTEALRPQIDEIRRNAQRLREQCERGEIKCEIIITEPGRP